MSLRLFWFGVLERVFPPRSEEDRSDWALIRITRSGRNEVKHSEQSAELCEWAVVKNRSERGEKVNDFFGDAISVRYKRTRCRT